MSKNVLIPISLLDKLITLLDYWDVSSYEYFIRYDYCDVLDQLIWKMQKIELRGAYSKILDAYNQDDRDFARIEYLRKRRVLREDISF